MKELPLGMKEDLVQATEEGRKTQTCRMQGLEEVNKNPDAWKLSDVLHGLAEGKKFRKMLINQTGLGHTIVVCPWTLGDWLWVKESTAAQGWDADGKEVSPAYKLLGHTVAGRWTTPRFMRKAYARIWVKVTDVQLRRVQSLTPEEIKNEGVLILVNEAQRPLWVLGEKDSPLSLLPKGVPMEQVTTAMVSTAWWGALWCRINGRASWEANPWVWMVKYEKTDKPL